MRDGCWLVLLHAAAVLPLAGLAWTVQLVVYPAFRYAGGHPEDREQWDAYHRAHQRGITAVVALPWGLEGLAVAGLLVTRPGPLVALAAAAAAVTGAVTVLGAVPLHTRLAAGWDRGLVDRLVRVHAVRTVAWTVAAAASLGMLRALASAP